MTYSDTHLVSNVGTNVCELDPILYRVLNIFTPSDLLQ